MKLVHDGLNLKCSVTRFKSNFLGEETGEEGVEICVGANRNDEDIAGANRKPNISNKVAALSLLRFPVFLECVP